MADHRPLAGASPREDARGAAVGLRKPAIFITGAGGEVGQGLIERLSDAGARNLIALDIREISPDLKDRCAASIVGDILDENLLQRLISQFEIHVIFHLAALLSTRAEYTPETAHRVNVEGTLNLLRLAHEQAQWHGKAVKFIFPSSIAVYGMPDLAFKNAAPPVREIDFNFPTTMYGCNKLYCEHLGRYFARHYRQLAKKNSAAHVDFRSLRFPGLISAVTMPTGGTSDYAVEMIHGAAAGEPYDCFVPPEARIPFMVMPDAIESLLLLADAPAERLERCVYNVTAFSLSAEQLRGRVLKFFPDAKIRFAPDPARARIVDSWPADVNDSLARKEWGWSPKYDADRAFSEYLIPAIRGKYHG